MLFTSLLNVKIKRFDNFVNLRVVEHCTRSRAPPFLSVHFISFPDETLSRLCLATATKNKIKKDSKIFINIFPGHLLFFIYLFSFLRGGGQVGV